MSFFSGRSRPLYRLRLWLRARCLSGLLLRLRIRVSLHRLRSMLYCSWLLLWLLLRLTLYRWLLLRLTLYRSRLWLTLHRWLLLRLTLYWPSLHRTPLWLACRARMLRIVNYRFMFRYTYRATLIRIVLLYGASLGLSYRMGLISRHISGRLA